jgi:hypothetical protein
MDVWAIIGILGGITLAIIGVSILLKYTGIGEFLGHVLHLISTFFQSVFSGLQSLIHAAPTPLKVVFFVLLFLGLGGVLYDSTIGLMHTCSNGQAYVMNDIFSAMVLNFMPGELKGRYEAFTNLPEDQGMGAIFTDSSGAPYITVPDKFAPGTATKLIGASGTGAIGKTTALYNFGLKYQICKTSNGACYLADEHWSSPRCEIKDNAGIIVIEGTWIYEITISYDQSKTTKNQGLEYFIKPTNPTWLSFITFAKTTIPISLDTCTGSDSDFPWLDTTGVNTFLDSKYGVAGKMFNSRQIRIEKLIRNVSGISGPRIDISIVANHEDPEYSALLTQANTRDSFLKNTDVATPINYTDADIIQFVCKDKNTISETLLIAGIPFFDPTIMILFIVIIVFLSIISYIRKY